MDLNKLVNQIQTFDWKVLKPILQKEEMTLLKNIHFLDDVLNALDPQRHTLGYIFILAVKVHMLEKMEPMKFVHQVQSVISLGDSQQIRAIPEKFCQICRQFAELCFASAESIRAILPLRTALKKLKGTSQHLTPLHVDFLQACLLAKTYSIALPILREEPCELSHEYSSITSRDLLLYFYYGSMVYTGLKEFKRAYLSARMAVSIPSISLSAIMIEAYKKYLLLSFLVYGKVISLPKYCSSALQRFHSPPIPFYQEFLNACQSHNIEEAHKIAHQYAEVFQKEKNFGLVKQCIQMSYCLNIQRFTQTYLTLSLQDISASVGLSSLKETENYVLRMIENRQIFATINQKDGMVSFQESPEKYDSIEMSAQLNEQIQRIINFSKRMRSIDEDIASSRSFLQKTSGVREQMASFSSADYDDFEGQAEMRTLTSMNIFPKDSLLGSMQKGI